MAHLEIGLPIEVSVERGLNFVEEQCKSKGLALTPIRRTVLELLLRSAQGMKAYDLLDQVRAVKPGATPPTIYRSLDFLMQHGFVHKISKINVFRVCTFGSHQHAYPGLFLVCPRCNGVEELDDQAVIGSLLKSVGNLGHTIASEEIEVSAVCPACQSRAMVCSATSST